MEIIRRGSWKTWLTGFSWTLKPLSMILSHQLAVSIYFFIGASRQQCSEAPMIVEAVPRNVQFNQLLPWRVKCKSSNCITLLNILVHILFTGLLSCLNQSRDYIGVNLTAPCGLETNRNLWALCTPISNARILFNDETQLEKVLVVIFNLILLLTVSPIQVKYKCKSNSIY